MLESVTITAWRRPCLPGRGRTTGSRTAKLRKANGNWLTTRVMETCLGKKMDKWGVSGRICLIMFVCCLL